MSNLKFGILGGWRGGVVTALVVFTVLSMASPAIFAQEPDEASLRTDGLPFQTEPQMSGKPHLLYFYTGDGIDCAEQTLILESLEKEYSSQVSFIEIDGKARRHLAEKYKVTSYPTIIFVSEDNGIETESARLDGFQSEDVLVTRLDSLLGITAETRSGESVSSQPVTKATPGVTTEWFLDVLALEGDAYHGCYSVEDRQNYAGAGFVSQTSTATVPAFDHNGNYYGGGTANATFNFSEIGPGKYRVTFSGEVDSKLYYDCDWGMDENVTTNVAAIARITVNAGYWDEIVIDSNYTHTISQGQSRCWNGFSTTPSATILEPHGQRVVIDVIFAMRSEGMRCGQGSTIAPFEPYRAQLQGEAIITINFLKADLLIKKGSEPDVAFAIDNVQQYTPSGDQVETQSVLPGEKAIYNVKIENDGTVEKSWVLKAYKTGSPTNFTTAVKAGGNDITEQILGTSGYSTATLPAGGSEVLTIEITPNTGGYSMGVVVRAYKSATDTGVYDAVQAQINSILTKPDLLIKQASEPDSAFASNNVYQTTPAYSQVETQDTAIGLGVGFDVKVQNDSTLATTFVLMAVESEEAGWVITYEYNGSDITTAITGLQGYTTSSLPAAGYLIINVVMTPEEEVAFSSSKSASILAYTDASDTTVNDSVRATARVYALIVNTTGDEPDSELLDGTNDVDLTTPGVQGTLRAAIMQVNYMGSLLEETVTILFDIPTGGEIPTIMPQSALPEITYPMVIDASSQVGGKVKLDGDYQPFNGFYITSGDTTIKGFIITHFGGGLDDQSPRGHGILIEGEGYNTIEDCQIGSGTTDELGNRGDGIHIQDSWDNVIKGNNIWNNAENGIYIGGYDSDDNEILGNFIGTDELGLTGLGNGTGIRIVNSCYNSIGSDWEPDDCNIIGGNEGAGIFITGEEAEDNWIAGNFIGIIPDDLGESVAIGNGGAGIEINAPYNEIAYNVISGNQVGIKLTGWWASENYVVGNYIGTDETGRAAMGNRTHGILITDGASNNEIGDYWEDEANLISGNGGDGIRLDGRDLATPRENWIIGNIIGTNIDGDTALPNTMNGVTVDQASSNYIGESDGGGNVISGNGRYGVEIRDEQAEGLTWGNIIAGNYIGLGVDGDNQIGNSLSGVRIYRGQRNIIRDNVVSGNGTDGIEITGAGSNENTVAGNFIGTDADGLVAIFNDSHGIYIGDSSAAGDEVSENIIGGLTAEDRNVIAGNKGDGVVLVGTGTRGNHVLGNYIGLNVNGTGRVISLEYRHFGPPDSGLTIEVANLGNGIYISDASETLVADNVISVNGGAGVMLVGAHATKNWLVRNRIGTDKNGTRITDPINGSPLGNKLNGVLVLSPENTIGGDFFLGEGNLISGNGENGILIIGREATRNEILSNLIGCDITGQNKLGNMLDGIVISDASNTFIGDRDGNGNVISGNKESGVQISGENAIGNKLQGNLIGTNNAGTVGLGNDCFGVFIEGAPGNYIGESVQGARNVISGNGFDGIYLSGDTAIYNEIKGNYIGTDVHAMTAIPNTYHGVFIENGASDNLIGGEALAAANVISGNRQDGVTIHGSLSTNNKVHGNFIGTQSDCTTAIPNGIFGVHIYGNSSDNLIGGVNSGAGNTIAFNESAGVRVESGNMNTILGNSIFENGGPGIDLGEDGITPNDGGDGDTGANEIQNVPVLTGANSRSTTILGTLNSVPNTSFRVEFFSSPDSDLSGYGEGQRYLGFMNVTTDSSGNVTFDIELVKTAPQGHYISATATDPGGNTSEFSASRRVTEGVSASADLSLTKTAMPVTVREAEILTYTLTVANHGPTDAHGVSVVDTLPAGVTFVTAAASQGAFINNQGVLTFSLGRLDSDTTATITITVKTGSMGTITNSATVTATEPDSNTANNTTTLQTQVIMGGADLSITKVDNPDPVLAGRTLTYELTVRNNGPRGATNVVVTDTLSTNVYFVSTFASQGICTHAAGTVTCNLGSINVGASVNITILVSPKVAGTVLNNATVTATEVDSNPANNTAVCSTAVNPGMGANLFITMTATPEPARVGRDLTYTLTTINLGPEVSNNITVYHTLPGNTTFVSLTTDHGTFSHSGRYSYIYIDTLVPGEKAIVTIIGKPNVAGNITSYGYVGSAEDPEGNNNGVQLDSTVISVPSFNLILSVRGNGATIPTAGTHSYAQGDEVTLKAIPDTGWVFSHWSGDVSGRATQVTITVNSNMEVTANFALAGTTLIGAIKQNPVFYEGKTVKLVGSYRGWESGHGTPPVTRSDWVIQDVTGSMYVTGIQMFNYPADVGQPANVSGIARVKDGQAYIEVPKKSRF